VNDNVTKLRTISELSGQYMKTEDDANASQHVFQSIVVQTELQKSVVVGFGSEY
jgi:hypothetical protein